MQKLHGLLILNNPEKTIRYANQALRLAETQNDMKHVASAYNMLGEAFFYQDDYANTLKYFEKLLALHKETGNKNGIAKALNNLGIVYSYIDNYEKSLEYYRQSIKLKKEVGDWKGTRSPLNNIGVIYEKKLQDYENALKYYKESLEIERQINDKEGIAISLNNIGDVYRKWNKPLQAIEYYKESLRIAQTNNFQLIVRDNFKGFYHSHAGLGEHRKALFFYEKYTDLKDSIVSAESKKQIAELEIKYQTEKNEQEIEHLNREKRIQLIIIYAFLGSFIIVVIFSVLLYRQVRQKKRANQLLAKQKQSITDSINYAGRIQAALLPSAKALKKLLPKHFIIYKPRDIVSGDFYWFKSLKCDENNQIATKYIIAGADCTGHGVPGAFMSLLGISFLNEIASKFKDFNQIKPGDMLNELRQKVKNALKQTGDFNETKDGMDIAICLVDKEKMQLQYAGAFMPVYIVSGNNKSTLTELKPTKNPIGIYLHEIPFRNETININNGDRLYIASDGFIDQSGGEFGRKFLRSNFKNLLFSLRNRLFPEHRQLLKQTIENWFFDKKNKETYAQVDDIMILGIEI